MSTHTLPVVPTGVGNSMALPFLVREVLLEGLVELAGDEARIDELFARWDGLLQGSQEETVVDFKRRLKRMAIVGQVDGIMVNVGYPMSDARYPALSVIARNAAEDTGASVLGDVLAITGTYTGTPTEDDFTSTIGTEHVTIGGGGPLRWRWGAGRHRPRTGCSSSTLPLTSSSATRAGSPPLGSKTSR